MENKSSYQISEQGVLGEVKIADDVIAVIAGIAATEVTGVARMCGNITNELVSKLGVNNLIQGSQSCRRESSCKSQSCIRT